MSSRTLVVASPHLKGADVKAWQDVLNDQMATWKVDYRIPEDGDYGVATRDLTASVLYGLGFSTSLMEKGVTPDLRIKVRNKRQSATEKRRYDERRDWRRRFALRHEKAGKVHTPLTYIRGSSWGWHGTAHDGVDLISDPNAPLLSICTGKVIRADDGGWWGKGAQASGGHPISDGDGITVVECTISAGPFKPGLRFCYGHGENPVVKVGQTVQAGQKLGMAGFANAWHIHFMVHGRNDARGIGDRDPMPYVRYALAND